MRFHHEDQDSLRQYLLGVSPSEDHRRQIEERLLTDGDFYEELLLAEDELIDHYLRGELSGEERMKFEQHFLSTPERHQKLRFARALRRYVSTTSPEQTAALVKKSDPSVWQRALSSPYLRIAAALIIVVGATLGFWRLFFYQSDLEKGLAALKAAYREQRPIEARISGFDYAPLITSRGGPEKVDYLARDRAERLLLDTVSEAPSPASHHALGQFYLAERSLDKAINQFEKGLSQEPNNAQIHNDLGAALLEMSRQAASDADAGKALEFLAEGLKHINTALQINPNYLDALYNKALSLQYMLLPSQAREAWQTYLSHDSQSKWAEEARRNLQLISESSAAPLSAPQLMDGFLAAFQTRDDEEAWQLMSRNKEMITGKLLPQQIAIAYLRESSAARRDESDKLLQALTYAGKLEMERAHDPYVSDMAAYYSRSSREQRSLLSQAQAKVTAGYDACLRTNYKEALEQFVQAKEFFGKAGDEWESRLCDYWIGYCYSQIDRIRESTTLLASLADYSQKKNYKWLLGQANCWLASNHAELDEHSKSIEHYNRALSIADEIGDGYNNQKILSQLASEYNHLGQSQRALDYHWRGLRSADSRYSSVRQLWRNYLYAARTLTTLKLYDAAAAFGGEMLYLALENIKEPGVIHYSYLYLGQIYGGLQQYEEALRLTSESLNVGRSLEDEYAARKFSAYSVLQVAHLQRQAGDCAGALGSYDEAIQTYDQMELSLYKYGAHKGRLLCYVALDDERGIEAELPIVLEQFDQYRAKILEEQNRNTFFDKEQNVYDIATNFAYTKGDHLRAFDHSESSRARSLLDSLNNRAQPTSPTPDTGNNFPSVSQPLSLTEIQGRLPANVQVVQYTVLDDKTLIWFITRDSFQNVRVNITSDDLHAKVSAYVKAIASGPSARADLNDRGRELYDTLIGPVSELLDSQKVLCLIPDKTISYMPFSALTSSRSGKYLIDEFSLLSSPSLNVFVLCSEASGGKGDKQSETLLSVGNPSFDRQDYPTLPDLPSAAREAKGIAKNYSTAYEFIGPDALRGPIWRRLPDADVVHFACHYVINERNPMSSKLILAKRGGSNEADDGSFTARELEGRKLPRAKLVVLSACQTNGDSYYNGEGMVGISRTFLATGIPLVVASQWPVDSEFTAELMLRFHRYRKQQELSTIDALRRAQLEMLNEPDGPYRDPYYWAAFLPVGGYADF